MEKLEGVLCYYEWVKKAQKFNFKLPYLLVACGAIGLLSAIILTVEKVHLLENPSAQLGCDLNPIIACGSVINTDQASAFGFPNPIIGIAGFSVVLTIGMALLAGSTFKRWFWLGLQGGAVFGVLFVHWLMFQSIYRIEALCPYCMVVWAVTIPIFWYTTLYNLKAGNLRMNKPGLLDFLSKHHGDILLVWFLIIAGLILEHFWYYWSTLI